ncbi:MAG: peptidoglycan DD-metalloendopeptidase family protein [Verrucomicrobia bacterium]|nr:peptidoglycan DD-metalloendopeptidase family protein [Verrucomicrobiota bacterium]
MDLFPIARDARGEAADPIFSILPGRVVYINERSGWSSYGRYLVVRHEGQSPAFHSLYAHLAEISPGIKVGTQVVAGSVLGKMGRSASGYTIPKSRAHLHFELGIMLTDDFEAWYGRQKFKTPNRHGNWNGMNLVSVDPLGFYEGIRRGSIRNFNDYLKARPVAARLRVFTQKVPSMVKDYPALLTRALNDKVLVAWDIAFTDFGLPKEWTPRFAGEGLEGNPGEVRILSYAPERLERQTCHRVLDLTVDRVVLTQETKATLEKLFGFH